MVVIYSPNLPLNTPTKIEFKENDILHESEMGNIMTHENYGASASSWIVPGTHEEEF